MVELKFDKIADNLFKISGIGPCGQLIHLGIIHELDNPNPLIEIHGPLGVNAVTKIVEWVNQHKPVLDDTDTD